MSGRTEPRSALWCWSGEAFRSLCRTAKQGEGQGRPLRGRGPQEGQEHSHRCWLVPGAPKPASCVAWSCPPPPPAHLSISPTRGWGPGGPFSCFLKSPRRNGEGTRGSTLNPLSSGRGQESVGAQCPPPPSVLGSVGRRAQMEPPPPAGASALCQLGPRVGRKEQLFSGPPPWSLGRGLRGVSSCSRKKKGTGRA